MTAVRVGVYGDMGVASRPHVVGVADGGRAGESSAPPALSGSTWKIDQWVRVITSADGKFEIGQVKATIPSTPTSSTGASSGSSDLVQVTTLSGFDLKVKPSQLRKAFLIVLDLNGVLVHRTKSKSVQVRPYALEFVQFALKNFMVAVWSSCIASNGEAIVDKVFGSAKKKLRFKWYRDECTPHPTAENPYGTIKELDKVWKQYPSSFSEANTVIIDDSPDKCSHPQNAFCPDTFAGAKAAEGDTSLMQVIQVLKQVIEQDSLEPLRIATSISPPPPHCIEEDEDDANEAPLRFLATQT